MPILFSPRIFFSPGAAGFGGGGYRRKRYEEPELNQVEAIVEEQILPDTPQESQYTQELHQQIAHYLTEEDKEAKRKIAERVLEMQEEEEALILILLH